MATTPSSPTSTTIIMQFVSLDDNRDRLLNSLWCPVHLVGTQCPDPTLYSYYSCCGELNNNCCSHLRLWLLVLIFSLPLFLLVPLICVLLRRIFGGKEKYERHRYERGGVLVDKRIEEIQHEELIELR